ncbi:hypothetical protein [Parabacteroides distasonis]|uniref:Uncharacterized protein n=1 Tax=Parabacteroides distasonis TaxID=823 RepID=A0A5C6KNE6_PARDI|nr:hypothetical protein [Parabacteroides distasonis]TWV64059.1 hypothetical protein FSA05_00090 [Parabacteroides distasonis]
MAKKQFIGIKRIWYADVITTAVTAAAVKALIASNGNAKEVLNAHQDTWGYEETDPEKTEYVNQLTGSTYYVDVTKGSIPTISFTMGEYSYLEKADLQGGEAITATGTKATTDETAVGWKRSNAAGVIEKAIIAQTKTGNYVVLTKANIVGKGNFVEKNIGLGVSAMALENGEIGSEFWFDGDAVEKAA